MQPDDNDIIYNSYGLDASFFENIWAGLSQFDLSFGGIFELIGTIWTIYSIFAFIISAIFIYGIIYAYIRIGQLSEQQSERLHEEEKRWKELHGGKIENDRWRSVQTHLSSDNPNDWKLAIIEADVLLERMLDKAGYAGTTVGEKLKSASSRSFSTIDDAWQAHRVRNQIAHGGADFVLTQKVANETLVLYERVFKEFSFI
jgi:hypothetical protein